MKLRIAGLLAIAGFAGVSASHAASLQTLVNFNGTNGYNPYAGLIADAAGNLFSTTYGGGAKGYGTVFEIVKTATGYATTPTTLVNFNLTDGDAPFGGLVADAAGNLFGTTNEGGTNTAGSYLNLGYGAVFEIAKTASGYAGTPATLFNFNGVNGALANGSYPADTLIADAAGDLFGTGSENGIGDGNVFEIAKTASGYASTPTILVKFNGSDGENPFAGLIADAAGDLFGTTDNGGANGDGTVFELLKNGANYTLKTLVSFNGTDGATPYAGLIADAAGDLFGTTSAGGAHGDGTVFEIVKTVTGYASTPTTLVSFNGTNGENPWFAGLIADAAGNLFGTTVRGGANGDGTVFEIAKTATGYASTPTILISFNGANGSQPYAGLIADAAGDLFGTTSQGGTNTAGSYLNLGYGTVFEITDSGFVQTLGQNAYITNGGSNTVSVVATASNTVTATITDPNFSGPIGVAVAPDGSRVYVANYASGTVSVIDTASNTVIGSPSTGGGSDPECVAVTPDGSRVYVATYGINSVSVMATASNTVIGSPIKISSGRAFCLAVTPDGSKVYVAGLGGGVSVIATASNTVIGGPIAVGFDPNGLAVTPDGSKVYVANNGSNSVSAIATASNTVIGSPITVGSFPTGVTVTPDGSKVFVTNSGSNTVSVIATATNTVTAAIPVGTNPVGLTVTPDGSKVFVANELSNNVSVIATASNTVTATIPVGDRPNAFGVFIARAEQATSDFNDDGKSDILWQNTSGQAAIWLMNGAKPITTALVGANPGTGWHVIGSGDFYGDGYSDVLWQNTNGAVAIWEMNGTKVMASAVVGNPGTSWHAIGTGDFNGDGYSDILWQNTNGAVAIWEMNGLKVIASAVIGNPGAGWQVVGSGNFKWTFNGHGDSDILLQNTASGEVEAWLMNGTQVIGSSVVGNPGPSWHAIGSGDFNDDGYSDILWQNSSGQAAIWLMNGTSPTTEALVGANPGPSWHAIGTGDFYGDGYSDILWQNTNGAVAIWEMNGTKVIASAVVGNPGTSWHAIVECDASLSEPLCAEP